MKITSWYVEPNTRMWCTGSFTHEPGYAVATYGEGKARVQISHHDFPDLEPEELTAKAVAILREQV